jgi:D-glycero-beta-D-manno-heptose 1-phosphate adenylyltransferase
MKIKSRNELVNIVKRLKNSGKKIVTCNGSFDIMHIGHIRFFKEAKAQGDILIVGLNSDSSIKAYKDPRRPINSQDVRAEFLEALEMIDFITIFDETDPIAFIEAIRPEIHCNGIEYGPNCIEADTVKNIGAKLCLINRFGDFSTTEMIEKIKALDVKTTGKI